jgi:hypothetical protein
MNKKRYDVRGIEESNGENGRRAAISLFRSADGVPAFYQAYWWF